MTSGVDMHQAYNCSLAKLGYVKSSKYVESEAFFFWTSIRRKELVCRLVS